MGSLFNPQVYNSTTYADQLAIQLGLYQDRLTGETADAFLDRLYSAAASRRDHTMEGVVNDIAYHLGLNVQGGIVITSPNPSTVITVSVGQLTITVAGTTTTIPTATIDSDDFWSWRMLSDVVADINSKTSCTAILQIPDTYAIQLVPQSSLGCSVAESVTEAISRLQHSGIVVGSELFNTTVPQYTLSSSGKLRFTSTPTAGTTISYIYNLSPFTLTCSEVSVISLMDPALQTTALCPDGSMVYQVREFVQQILAQDPCYWGN
jgi:hypothetical protein